VGLAEAVIALLALILGTVYQGESVFFDDKNVADAGDYTHIMPLAFLTFSNIYVKYSL
jgi:hypothetical protein